jgi:transposase-like protein
MGQYRTYSPEFKEALITKIMNRGSSTVAEVCETVGVRPTTAHRWQKLAIAPITPSMKTKTKNRKWSAQEKFQALSVTLSASESETGAYLRQEGLHSQQLAEWRCQALTALESTAERSSAKDPRDERIKQLEREVLRKDKALAEASALLILQKKTNLIWGDEDPK